MRRCGHFNERITYSIQTITLNSRSVLMFQMLYSNTWENRKQNSAHGITCHTLQHTQAQSTNYFTLHACDQCYLESKYLKSEALPRFV